MRTRQDLLESALDVPPGRRATFDRNSTGGLVDTLERNKSLVVLCIITLAFAVRIYRLDAAGLAEDEVNKVFAVRAYEQGDFSANAEHPMLLKLLCYASVHGCESWNRVASEAVEISDEAAIRLPNVIVGSLTALPLFFLTMSLLGFRAALLTTLLWALGLDAVWFNRIAKEDTLQVFMLVSAFCLYNRAKHQPASNIRAQEIFYGLAGAAFGLAMASKYIPHYVLLNALFYTLIGYDSRNNRPLTRRMWGCYFGAMLLAFALFNWALFEPQTWRYLSKYLNEELVTHHGYQVMDRLFINDIVQSPGGNPWYFYILFLLVKLPLPVLAAFAIGLVEIFRKRSAGSGLRGYLFLRMMLIFWIIPMSVIGAKFLRYSLPLMPLVYMTAAVGAVAAWRYVCLAASELGWNSQMARHAIAAAVVGLFAVAPSLITLQNMPYPSLYVNALGGKRAGYFFPHDEFYDLGARESINYISQTAPPGAAMASEIPGVVDYYLERNNRTDLRSEIMSQPGFTLGKTPPVFVLLQPGRIYFESRADFTFVERTFPLAQSSNYGAAIAARVFRTRDQPVAHNRQQSNPQGPEVE